MQNKAWGQCEANGGLESLAAEASRRTEKYEAEGDLETQPDAKGERQSEHGKGQKTKVILFSMASSCHLLSSPRHPEASPSRVFCSHPKICRSS